MITTDLKKYLNGGSAYGRLMFLAGLLVAGPVVILPFYPSEFGHAIAFLLPAVISMSLGSIISVVTYRHQEKTYEYQAPVQRGSLPVLFVWLYSFLLGAVPLLFTGQLSLIQALFESVSGWTTTSITVLDIRTLPHIFLFYRSYIQFFGGIGFILVLSMFVRNRQTVSLYSAEGHTERVMPNVRKSAQLIFLIYSVLLIVGSLLYWICGVDFFDAVCQTMSAVSTAGFSTHPGGIATYDNLAIEIITIILMLIGASNFATLLVLTEGKLRRVFKSTEMRFMLGLVVVFVVPIAMTLFFDMKESLGQSIRHAVFAVVSAFSTTGYTTGSVHYTAWPPFALGLLMLLMCVGGSSGSTSGGIKLIRGYFILRITRENVLRQLSSAIRTDAPTYNSVREKVEIDRSLVADTFSFLAIFFGILLVGTLLLTLTAGCSLFDAMFEFTAVLGTSGISTGLTNADTNAATLCVEMAGMILGRLEIFVVFYGLVAFVKRIKWALRK